MSYFRDDRTIYFTALTLFCQKGLFIKTPCEEKFEDTNGVIISLTLKRTDNTMAKTKTDKRTNNDLQNITLKT
jgi:hypothetical protein